eukprot:CAMPEP_0204855166 /NCGR_PEP_ID=MMETSP1347-20130617/16308_1 /ASSEMBLY_ACC=CAM_ASM_000690 /TAXON_ID=215587 /ORGANISM="Aplanochytrium stocchinoi, Strain GSBS06" /LENGTH=86 /DNA_ID=CAMNT_0052001133 /DNA_START=164 /DNA_END=421 /DNA_ORIENTATION=+
MVVKINREDALRGSSWKSMAAMVNSLQSGEMVHRHCDYAECLEAHKHYPLAVEPLNFWTDLSSYGGKLCSGFYLKSVYNKNMLRLK